MPVPMPTATTRWRCGACGNLTRFDVTRRSRAVEYVHLDLAGVSRVEERTVLDEVVEQVRCRWCDGTDQIELVPRTDTDHQAQGRGVEEAASGEEATTAGGG